MESHYICFFIPLTGVELTVKLQIQESVEKQYTHNPPNVRPAMRSQKIADSDKQSIGYETMTTVSGVDFEVRFGVFSLNTAQTEIHVIKREIFRYNVKKIATRKV